MSEKKMYCLWTICALWTSIYVVKIRGIWISNISLSTYKNASSTQTIFVELLKPTTKTEWTHSRPFRLRLGTVTKSKVFFIDAAECWWWWWWHGTVFILSLPFTTQKLVDVARNDKSCILIVFPGSYSVTICLIGQCCSLLARGNRPSGQIIVENSPNRWWKITSVFSWLLFLHSSSSSTSN